MKMQLKMADVNHDNLHFRKIFILSGLGLSLSTASFVSVSVQSVFPYLAGALSVNQSNAVWTLTFLVIHWALGILLMPHVSARIGLSHTYRIAIFLLLAGSVMSGETHSFLIMLLSRAFEGLGAGLLVPLTQVYFMAHSTNRHRTMMLWSLSMLLPFFFGPVVAGYFAEHITYRLIFYLSIPAFLASFLMVGNGLPKNQEKFDGRFDWGGLLTIYLFLLSSILLMSQGERYGWLGSRFILTCFLVAGVSLGLFILAESRAKNPLVPISLLSKRSFLVGLLSLSVLWSLYMAWSTLIPLFASAVLKYNGFYSGLLLVSCGVGYILGASLYNSMAKHIHHDYLAIISVIFMFLFLFTIHVSPMLDIDLTIYPMLFLGFSVAFMFVPFNLIMFSDVQPADRAIASAASNFIRVYLSSVAVELLHIIWQRYSMVYYAALSSQSHPYISSPLAIQYSVNMHTSLSWSMNVCASISRTACVFVFIVLLFNLYVANSAKTPPIS